MYQKSAILNFPKKLVDRPVISSLIRDYDVEVNILQASITPEADGRLFAIFHGSQGAVKAALGQLKESGVRVVLPAKNLVWDDEKCVDCTACVGHCTSSAFTVDPETLEVRHDAARCIACELCIPACLYGALESIGDHLRKRGEL